MDSQKILFSNSTKYKLWEGKLYIIHQLYISPYVKSRSQPQFFILGANNNYEGEAAYVTIHIAKRYSLFVRLFLGGTLPGPVAMCLYQ